MSARANLAASWILFYGAILVAWAGLVLLAAEALPAQGPAIADGVVGMGAAAFIARCLDSVATFDILHLVGMWGLMSLGMMLPTAIPVMQRLADMLRGRAEAQRIFLAFAAGYLVIWSGFSFVAAGAQWLLARAELIDAVGRTQSASFAALLFCFAGGYQFTGLKQACLTRCRHPMTFFIMHWRSGQSGALRMGLRHGLDCFGCCWPLMLLAFVGGTMNLAWMGLAMALMLMEKLAGAGRYVTAPLGVLLILAAGFSLGEALQAM
jgi:predicted metal-binding membrane protein